MGTGAGAGSLAVPGHLLTRPGGNWSHWAELGRLSDAHACGLVRDPSPMPGPGGELSPAVPGGFGHGGPLHAGAARLRLRAGGARGAAASPAAEPGPAQRQRRYHPLPGSPHPTPIPRDPRRRGLSPNPLLPRGAALLAEEGEGSAPLAALLGCRRAGRGGDDRLRPPGLPLPAPSVLRRPGHCLPNRPLAQQAAKPLRGLRLHAGTGTRVHGLLQASPLCLRSQG